MSAPTYQARLHAALIELDSTPLQCNTAHVSPAGIASVRDASGLIRAARLSTGSLLELAEEIRVALEARRSA